MPGAAATTRTSCASRRISRGTAVFKLEENYRSTQFILDAANELVENNKSRAPKKLFTKREKGEPVTVYGAETERAEARYVMEKIKELVREGAAYRDFLVLYRTNAQSRVFEEGFADEGNNPDLIVIVISGVADSAITKKAGRRHGCLVYVQAGCFNRLGSPAEDFA